jgi:pimeloyl-ACP methyl ester carboxylesterase
MGIVYSVRPRILTALRARSGRARLLDRQGTRSNCRACRPVRKNVIVDGRPVVYGDAGLGPPLLFLHGWGLDHQAYQWGLTRLVTAGLRVIAPALPGFGGTAPLDNSDCTIRSYAAWVDRFLDALGVEEPLVVTGHSFGGGVAIVVAHDQPERVRQLVLINSIGASAWAQRGSTIRLMSERPLWDWGLHFGAELWPLGQARRVLPITLCDGLPNLVREPRALWHSAKLARSADLTTQLEELRRRRVPIVVVWGSRDQIITRASLDHMCEALGQPATVTVDGTHSWLIADPNAFGEVMINDVGITATLPTPQSSNDGGNLRLDVVAME